MNTRKKKKMRTGFFRFVAACAAAMFILSADLSAKNQCLSCSQTALMALKASLAEAQNDYWIAKGNSYNVTDPEAKIKLLQEAKEALGEAVGTSTEQYQARIEICEMLGEAPYDPQIDPENFVDFEKVLSDEESFTPNQHFPLIAGNTWEYLAFDEDDVVGERILVEVLDETKEILGVNCIVVHDQVWEIDDEGEEALIEDTFDWYAQDLSGNIWYFGEISLQFEDGELVDLEGSWKAGRDYAKAGFQMLADPQEDDVYRQEFLLNEAEDMAEVASRGEAAVSVAFGDYDEDVLETMEWTPIEPDVLEFKYYAPNVGMVLEVNPETGERVELIDMTTP